MSDHLPDTTTPGWGTLDRARDALPPPLRSAADLSDDEILGYFGDDGPAHFGITAADYVARLADASARNPIPMFCPGCERVTMNSRITRRCMVCEDVPSLERAVAHWTWHLGPTVRLDPDTRRTVERWLVDAERRLAEARAAAEHPKQEE